jgi:hypothetical protein
VASRPRLTRVAQQSLVHRRGLAPIRFVVVTPGRSGSIFLLKLLDSHPHVTGEGEILARPSEDPTRVMLTHCWAAGAGGSRAWGFALHPRHLVLRGIEDKVAWMTRLHDHGVRPIVLIRANPIAHAVSAMIAAVRESWHAYDGETKETEKDAPVELDLDVLLRSVARSEHEADDVRSMVGLRSHVWLTYEDDLASGDAQQATLRRVFDYLDVEPCEVSTSIARRSTPLAEMVSNWAPARELLVETRWASYLEAVETS